MIYLDNSATTKPSDASLNAMREALSECWGNPGSVHRAGDAANALLQKARRSAEAAFCIRRPADGSIIFTSGGSEANNLAMLGSVRAKNRPERSGSRGTVMIGDGEHASVEEPAAQLSREGFTVLHVPTRGGRLDLDFIREHADASLILCAFMLVNNETGAVYDIKGAADIVRAASPKAFIHCDAVQAFMKMPLIPKALGADSISVSSHKIYAPKGAGALYVTAEVLRAKRLVPVIYGGGQEAGLRSGTENVPAIAAFGAACDEGMRELSARAEAVKKLSSYLAKKLPEEVRINEPADRLAGIVNITLPDIRSETMLNYLSGRDICVSAGSACSAHSGGVSRALTAFGLPENEADCSLRISLSHENTKAEIDELCAALKEGINKLCRKSK